MVINRHKRKLLIIVPGLIVLGLVITFFLPRPFHGRYSAAGDELRSWYLTIDFSAHLYHLKGYPPIDESGWYLIDNIITEGDQTTYTLRTRHDGQWDIMTVVLSSDGTATIDNIVMRRKVE